MNYGIFHTNLMLFLCKYLHLSRKMLIFDVTKKTVINLFKEKQ